MATIPLEKITKEIVDFSRRERLTRMRPLLDLEQPSKGEEIEKAWDQEIRARVKAVDEGRDSLNPIDRTRARSSRTLVVVDCYRLNMM